MRTLMGTGSRTAALHLAETGEIFRASSSLGIDVWKAKREVLGLCVGRNGKINGGKIRSLQAKSSSNFQSAERIKYWKKVNGVNGSEDPYVGRSIHLVDGNEEAPVWAFKLGRFVEDRFVYRQNFVIRSYEIGPDQTATMETLMNLLQETALNHAKSSGLARDGFGSTYEMSLRKLIWVVTRINVQVEKYSCWGDVIEIDTWVAPAGKNGMRRDWIIRDYNTQEIITKATSTWVIMNRETRRLCKIPEQVLQEVKPFYLDIAALVVINKTKIDKLNDETAESIRSGIAPRWSDMDVNQHVNNVKYIGWILESVPMNVLEDYNLTNMTLEYRRECRQFQVLESLTKFKDSEDGPSLVNSSCSREHLGSTHLLRMEEDKAEIVRASAEWQSKGTEK